MCFHCLRGKAEKKRKSSVLHSGRGQEQVMPIQTQTLQAAVKSARSCPALMVYHPTSLTVMPSVPILPTTRYQVVVT